MPPPYRKCSGCFNWVWRTGSGRMAAVQHRFYRARQELEPKICFKFRIQIQVVTEVGSFAPSDKILQGTKGMNAVFQQPWVCCSHFAHSAAQLIRYEYPGKLDVAQAFLPKPVHSLTGRKTNSVPFSVLRPVMKSSRCGNGYKS